MDNRDFSNIGQEIRDTIAESMRTGDFTTIGDTIAEKVDDVLQMAKNASGQTGTSQGETIGNAQFREVNSGSAGGQGGQGGGPGQNGDAGQGAQRSYAPNGGNAAQRSATAQATANGTNIHYGARTNSSSGQVTQQSAPAYVQNRNLFLPKDKTTGTVLTILGVCDSIISVVAIAISAGVSALGFGGVGYLGIVLWGLALLIGIVLMVGGGTMASRADRATKYFSLMKGRTYISIEDLAKGTGKSRSFIAGDLRSMLARGMFPQGHLDDQKTQFILNDATYKQYLLVEQERKAREKEAAEAELAARLVEAEKQKKERAVGVLANSRKEKKRFQEEQEKLQREQEQFAKEHPELAAIIAKGNEYIQTLHEQNQQITDEDITAKLFHLEALLQQIFDGLKSHPEAQPKMKKTMDYFLPTTVKLVESYGEFSKVENPGPEISSAMHEIEKTLDTINESFNELLNQLFSQSVMDATVDAKVLQTMLAQEGLSGRNIRVQDGKVSMMGSDGSMTATPPASDSSAAGTEEAQGTTAN